MRNLTARPKIGVMVDNLGPSQLAFSLINKANLLRTKFDVAIFTVTPMKPAVPAHCGIFNVGDAFGFDGVLASTDLYTTKLLQNCINAVKRYFYCWNLDWMEFGEAGYGWLSDKYYSFPIIARSVSHQRSIENAWNIKVNYVEDSFRWMESKEILKDATSHALFVHNPR